jgi:hypothetical protein
MIIRSSDDCEMIIRLLKDDQKMMKSTGLREDCFINIQLLENDHKLILR